MVKQNTHSPGDSEVWKVLHGLSGGKEAVRWEGTHRDIKQ